MKIEYCNYCLDRNGKPKPVFDDNIKNGRKMKDGSYICGHCITERMLKLNGG